MTDDDFIDLFEDHPYAHRKKPPESDDAGVSQKRPRITKEEAELEERIIGGSKVFSHRGAEEGSGAANM